MSSFLATRDTRPLDLPIVHLGTEEAQEGSILTTTDRGTPTWTRTPEVIPRDIPSVAIGHGGSIVQNSSVLFCYTRQINEYGVHASAEQIEWMTRERADFQLAQGWGYIIMTGDGTEYDTTPPPPLTEVTREDRTAAQIMEEAGFHARDDLRAREDEIWQEAVNRAVGLEIGPTIPYQVTSTDTINVVGASIGTPVGTDYSYNFGNKYVRAILKAIGEQAEFVIDMNKEGDFLRVDISLVDKENGEVYMKSSEEIDLEISNE